MLRQIRTFNLKKQLLLCLCSALLLILSFPWVECWVLAWVAFIPLFLALEGASGRRAFLLSYFTGLLFWAGTIFWLVHVTLLGVIVLVAYLAVYFGLFGLLVSRGFWKPTGSFLIIPALWVVLEYVRSHFLTGFGWALLGYSQYRVPLLIQIADITGVWGVSFLVMVVNVCLYSFLRPGGGVSAVDFQRRRLSRAQFIGALLIITGSVIYGFLHMQHGAQARSERTTVALIQPNIPQELKWDPRARGYILNTLFRLTEAAARTRPDMIIWPEAAVPGIVGEDRDVVPLVYDFIDTIDIPVLLGAVVFDRGDYYNAALLVDKGAQSEQRYFKVHRVPFGEYIPLKHIFPFLESIVPIGDIAAGTDYTLFKPATGLSTAAAQYGVVICFEDLFPGLVSRFVKRGADILVNITNDAWYKFTPAAQQHFIASVFRAVENRRPLIRVANTGVSGVITEAGVVRSVISGANNRRIFVEGIDIASVPGFAQSLSIYTRFPDLFILLCIALILADLIRLRRVPYERRRR